jgi:hypothetical protein
MLSPPSLQKALSLKGERRISEAVRRQTEEYSPSDFGQAPKVPDSRPVPLFRKRANGSGEFLSRSAGECDF